MGTLVEALATELKKYGNLKITKMRIAWCSDHALYFNGGIRYIFEVTCRLAKWCKVDLVVQDISSNNDKMFSEADVEVLNMEETTANKLRYWLFYPYYLLKHALMLREAQTQYGFNVWISSSPTTHILCWIAGIRPICVVFELNPWLYNSEYRKGLSKIKLLIMNLGSILAKWLERKAYENASRIIVYSKYIQSEVKRVYGVESEVVYTGVDSEFFKPTHNPEIEDKYKDKQVILHVASYLSPMKGTDLAVEAMGIINQEFPNALLLIINSHNDIERQNELKQKAVECGANIEFVTSVKDSDLPVYYTMAKCLLSPSLDENVHLPVLEASCCETPTVSLIMNMDSEDIKGGETGWLAVNYSLGNIRLAQFVRSILKDPITGIILGKNARKFVKERFNWEQCLSEYKRIIGEVVNG